jgi:hypothetical protein
MPGGGRSSGMTSQSYSTTQYVNAPTAPVVIHDLDFDNPIHPDFLSCTNRAVTQCWRQFGTSQTGFSDCLYGFLVSSRLLPKEVAALATQARISTTGAFAEGASLSCELTEPGNNYPAMVSYY